MTIELVFKPFVKAIAYTVMDADALVDFIAEHGLMDVASQRDTPIGQIVNTVNYNDKTSSLDLLAEFAGRFCYRSWDKGRSHKGYIANILEEGHGNVLAHGNVSLIITGVSRSLTHELVRHHVGTNPSQESQRYVTADGGELEVTGFMAHRAVVPPLILSLMEKNVAETAHGGLADDDLVKDFIVDYLAAMETYDKWRLRARASLEHYTRATIKKKRSLEAARCFLPNAAETRLVWTMNMRAARNVLEQRGNEHADLEIRRLAVAMYQELFELAPEQLRDFERYRAEDGFDALRATHSKI